MGEKSNPFADEWHCAYFINGGKSQESGGSMQCMRIHRWRVGMKNYCTIHARMVDPKHEYPRIEYGRKK